jgi:hypothetical protein
MTLTETLTAFASDFVKESLRDRFVDEALKQPTELHARICHRITEVFPEQFRDGSIEFEVDAACFVLGRRPHFEETTWHEASRQLCLGDGVLVIDRSGEKFYAETAGSPISEVWAGGL